MRVSLVGHVPQLFAPRLSKQVEEGLEKLELPHGFNRNATQHSIIGGGPVKARKVTASFVKASCSLEAQASALSLPLP